MPKLLDVVALTEDVPERGLRRGQVGTVVDEFEGGDFDIEFANVHGETYALLTVRTEQVMVLHHEPVAA